SHIEDDVALYWLQNPASARAAAAALTTAGASPDPAVARVFTSATPGFRAMFGDPRIDPHTPDVIVQPRKGVIYSLSAKKFAGHGGLADDDAHGALLVSNPALEPGVIDALVRTKQVAPTVLSALGLETRRLRAVRAEGTRTLPGLELSAE